MIRITKDKLIIEIPASAPFEQLLIFKTALLKILASGGMKNQDEDYSYWVTTYCDLLKEFEFDAVQFGEIYAAFGKHQSLQQSFAVPTD